MENKLIDKQFHATLSLKHVTRFDYTEPVVLGYSEMHMMPSNTALQQVIEAGMRVSPACDVGMHRDYFGNIVHHFNILGPHRHVEIISEAIVHTENRTSAGEGDPEDARPAGQRFAEFLHWSKGVPMLDEYASVRHDVNPAMHVDVFEQSLSDLAAYFVDNFRYDPDVTHVHSTPKELFEHGGGVCQDMAHAMIGVLRLAGIPTRYVSGYIYDAHKAEAKAEQVRGAAATHAWVQAWHPEGGWCGIDPTNNKPVGWQYIRTAVGRDYYDVTPVKGLFRGDVEQQLTVEVEVSRIS